jgi:hypothetical protein
MVCVYVYVYGKCEKLCIVKYVPYHLPGHSVLCVCVCVCVCV